MADPNSKQNRKKKADQKPEPDDGAVENHPAKPAYINWKRVDWLVRTGFVLILAYMTVSLVGGLLFPRSLKVVEPDSASKQDGSASRGIVPDDSLFLMNDFLDGNWSFGDSKWEFNSSDVSEIPGESEFAKPPEKLRQADEEFDDETFINIFESFRASRKKVGQLTYWQASYLNSRGSMYTSSSPNGEVVQILRVAFPVGSGKFSYIEATPTASASVETADSRQLLPLCPGAETMATRSNSQGVVSSAFVSLKAAPGVILKYWTDQGWSVTPVFRPGISDQDQYRCEKESVGVVATFIKADGNCTIMLVRIPDVQQ